MGISDIGLREERAREDREDEAIEKKLRNDFCFFVSYYSDKFEELNELKKEVKNLYEYYGWEMEEWQWKILQKTMCMS